MNSFNSNMNYKYGSGMPFKANYADVRSQNVSNDTVELPDLYYVPDHEPTDNSLKDNIKNVDVFGIVYPWLEHPLLMAGTCAGLAYGVDKFSEACGGQYDKSLLGKAAKLGDNIHNSSAAKSSFVKYLLKLKADAINTFNKLTKNSDVINAMRTTPSMPEWSMVKDELLSQEQRVVHDFVRITDTLGLSPQQSSGGIMDIFSDTPSSNGKIKLKNLALTKAEKSIVRNIANEEEAVNTVLLKRLGRTEAEIQSILAAGNDASALVKAEILKEMGLTPEQLQLIKKDSSGKYIKEVLSATEKVKGKVWIGAGNYSLLGPVQPFERRIGCDEVYNRLQSLSNDAVTSTGKAVSKFLQRCHRGFTFGGGKLGVLMFVGPHLVETMINTKKADPDAKVGTVFNGVISAASWVFTFPLGLKIMHSMAGVQYAGMSKDKVEEYRQYIRDFNEKVTTKQFKSKAEYDSARKVLKNNLEVCKKSAKPQNLLTKALKKVGSFLTMDLEQIKSYRSGTMVGNTYRKLPSFFKNLGGIPIRFILWGVITMGVLDSLITKATKTVFGNFYDGFKEEENKANKKKQKEFLRKDLKERMLEAQRNKLQANSGKTGVAGDNEISSKNVLNSANDFEANSAKDVLIGADNVNKTLSANNETGSSIQNLRNETLEENSLNSLATESVEENPMLQNSENLAVARQKAAVQSQIAKVKQESANNQAVQHRYIPNPNPNPELLKQAAKSKNNDVYTYIPSQENILQGNTATQTQRYIPSQLAGNLVKNFDNSGLESALRRADRAEAKALKVLSGQFN